MKKSITKQAIYIAVIYFVVSAGYIYFSDTLLARMVKDTETFSRIEGLKGIAFVLLSALLILVVVDREMRKKNALIRDLIMQKNEFEALNEEYLTSIEELHNANEMLGESEVRYRNIFNNRHIIMFLIDPENATVVDVNPAAEEYYGRMREEFIGMKVADINVLTEDLIKNLMDEVLHKGKSAFELKHKLSNGEIRDVEVFTGPIKVNRKELIYSIVTDITERKNSRQELIQAKVKAEENDKLKSAFLNNMSHEIRTPMNGILGFSSLLMQEGLTDEKRREFIRIIENSGEQLVRIIDDIIDYSRIETGQVQVVKKEFGLNEMLDTLLAMLEQEAGKRNKNVELRLHKGLPNGNDAIVSDRGRLAQIITNLAMNALKFTEKGFIETGYLIQGRQIEFYVKDTGIGIPVHDQEKVFDRFHQANIDIARSYSGTGLGLSIAKGLTELLGGNIDFISTQSTGTTFFVRIPYEQAVHGKSRKKVSSSITDFHGKTILVAEDVPESMELINSYFSGSGALIVKAANGKEAVELITGNQNIDVVLMDIRMPVMDGLEAMKAIKKIRPGMPVIAQTAYAMSIDRSLFLDNGFDDYISKPLDKRSLMLITGKYLGGNNRPG